MDTGAINSDSYKKKYKEGIIKNKKSVIFIGIALVVALIVSIIVAINLGPVSITVKEVVEILSYNIFGIGDPVTIGASTYNDIVWKIRFPRILLAICVGAGLSVVGAVMQAMVQNPLAEPYILGISSGASLGATAAIMLGLGAMLGTNSIGIFAFIGAFICSMAVYSLANMGGKSTSIKLLMSGMVISAICSSFSSFIIFISNDAEGMRSLTFWTMGSLAGASWNNIGVPMSVTVVGVMFFIFQFRNLNVMLLGDENAITLGIDLNKHRKLYMIITSFMTGIIVYASGTIGFVGLIIPHIVRMIVGSDHRRLIPISAIVGGIFLIWTDAIARSVMNVEIPIGVITSMLGAPFFMWLMIKKSYGFGGK